MSSSALPPMLLPSNMASSPNPYQAYPQTPVFFSPDMRSNSWTSGVDQYGWASSPAQYYLSPESDSRNQMNYIHHRNYHPYPMFPFPQVGYKQDPRILSHQAFSDRPHLCHFPGCGRMFKRLEHLKRHHRSIHTNERPYHCHHPSCNKSFSRSDNLAQHMRIHRQSTLQPQPQPDPCNNCPC